jgi:hypothetical protein
MGRFTSPDDTSADDHEGDPQGAASITPWTASKLPSEMTGAFEKIPGIAAAAIGALGDELTFSFPEVLGVIGLCTMHEIAVLGLELFQVLPEGYATKEIFRIWPTNE